MKTVKDYIRTIPDFPHEGILFRDVTTLFGDPRGFFVESYNRTRYRQAGIALEFMQDNFSFSCRHAFFLASWSLTRLCSDSYLV